jgi:signal transduction histidine kinase/putative methionine-R-sulfoxide reductase with GAF domain
MANTDSEERLLAAVRVLPLEERLSREEAKVRALQEIAEALRSTLNLNDLLRLILAKITTLMDADRATLYLVDESTDELWSHIIQGDEVLEIRLPIGQGIAGSVAQTGRSVVLRDAYKDPRFHGEVDQKSGYRTRSMLCVAMRDNRGHIVGVIQVLNKLRGYFSPEDEQLLATLAAHAAISIEISRLYTSVVGKNLELVETQRRLEQKVRELDLLYEAEQRIGAAKDTAELLEIVAARAAEATGARAALIALVEEGAPVVRAAFGAGPSLPGLRLSRGEGLIGLAIERGEALSSEMLAEDPRHSKRLAQALPFRPRACLVVPMRDEAVVGAVALLDKRSGLRFGEEEQKLATLLAGRAAQALSAQRAREERYNASRLEAIGRMLSGILHDFKTPMAIVSGYAQLAAEEEDADARKRHAQSVLRQLELIDGMVRELLSFAKGETQLLLRRVHVNEFMRDLEKMTLMMLEGRPIEVEFDGAYRGVARFDEVKITRAAYNIIRNAIQAMPQGGRLSIRAAREGDELVFAISDTGAGIPQEIEGKVFDSFVTHGKQDGTGLGLSIVKKAVEDHDGRVEYASRPGAGTTFRLALPLNGPAGA